MEFYTKATAAILDPKLKTTRSLVAMGRMKQLSMARFSGPLVLNQSVLVVMPYIITLVAISTVCLAISYTVFMKQEIRSI